jgi:predicted nucleotidyltransferase
MIREVFRAHEAVAQAKLFGSRAKGTHQPYSDIDIAIWGNINTSELGAILGELEELPLPYRFDVVLYDRISQVALRAHIDRVGKSIYQKRGENVLS